MVEGDRWTSLERGAAAEQLPLAGMWYDSTQRAQQMLTQLVCCVLRMDQLLQAEHKAEGLAKAFCRHLKLALVAKAEKRPEFSCEECALAAALALIYRLLGDFQVGILQDSIQGLGAQSYHT